MRQRRLDAAPGEDVGKAFPLQRPVPRAQADDDVRRVAAAAVVLDAVDDLLPDAPAGLRVPQPRDQRLRPARLRPLRDHGGDRGLRGGVRILIDGDVDPARPRRVHQGEAVGAAAPRAAAERLVVGDLHRDAGLRADPYRLAHRVEQSERLVAHVRDVDAAVARRHRGERDDLFGRGEAAGDVEQAGGQPEGAFFHRLGDERPHAVQLVARRFAVVAAHDRAADRSLAGEDRPVRTDAGVRDARQVLADRPGRAAVVPLGQRRDALQQVVVRRRHVEDAAHRVRVRIDEPGRHHQPPGVEDAVRGRVRQVADARDAVAAHRDVGAQPRIARAVDHPSAADEQVEPFRVLGGERRRGQDQREEKKEPSQACRRQSLSAHAGNSPVGARRDAGAAGDAILPPREA